MEADILTVRKRSSAVTANNDATDDVISKTLLINKQVNACLIFHIHFRLW